jgi:alkylation response protein AidB-like acyl-CoA dehydrogenase
MDFHPSEEQRLMRDVVARIGQRYGRSYWLSKIGTGQGPDELWKALADAGYIGLLVPEEYGGAGLGMLDMEVLLEAVAENGTPLLFLVVSAVMGTLAVVKHGTEEQKRRWLPPLVEGKARFCFALTEPDAGSNSFRIATRAVRDGDTYRVTGRKTFISGADVADDILTVVRTTPFEELADKRAGMSLLVIPASSPGLEKRRIDVAMEGPESQFLLFFDDVAVPAANRIGPEGGASAQMFDVLNAERISGAAVAIGLARYALAKAVRYAKERKVWNVPVGAHQGLQHPLAQVKCRVEAASLLAQKAAFLFDRGEPAGAEANMAKYEAAEAAITACDLAVEVHGGNGFSREFDVITLWPWARLLRTAPVSREMVLSYIGEHVLGLPRSY